MEQDKMLVDLTSFLSFLGASLKQATGTGKRPEFDAIRSISMVCESLSSLKKKKARPPKLAEPNSVTHRGDCKPPFGWLKWHLPIISLAELSAPIMQPPCYNLTERKRGVDHTQENPYPILNFPLPSQFNSQRILPCLSLPLKRATQGPSRGLLRCPDSSASLCWPSS